MLRIYDVVLGILRDLRPLIGPIERHDPDLARQLKRASASVALNIAEGAGGRGRNQDARYHSALGSMRETLACIHVASALGYINNPEGDLLSRIDRVIATLYRIVM
jgi:four helix bundle protein